MKHRLVVSASVAVFMVLGTSTEIHSNDGSTNDLSTSDIFKKTREAYAALTSYSDEGTFTLATNDKPYTSSFKIKLARPNLYKVEWIRTSPPLSNLLPPPRRHVVWNAGHGDCLDEGFGIINETKELSKGPDVPSDAKEAEVSREMALTSTLETSIACIFFDMREGRELFDRVMVSEIRQPDEQVAGVDCYVFSCEVAKEVTTLWIGKQDFLIHQIRHFHNSTMTETHTNIVLNQTFVPADFEP